MRKLSDEVRSAIGLPPEPETKEKGIFQNATGSMVRTMLQLSQHRIYADMEAASMDDRLNARHEQGRIVTETTTRRVSSRRVPDVEDYEPTVEDYDFIPGT